MAAKENIAKMLSKIAEKILQKIVVRLAKRRIKSVIKQFQNNMLPSLAIFKYLFCGLRKSKRDDYTIGVEKAVHTEIKIFLLYGSVLPSQKLTDAK